MRRTEFFRALVCMVAIGFAGLVGICRVGRAGMDGIEVVAQAQSKPIADVKPTPAPEMETVVAPAESASEIRNAMQNQEAARLVYESAQKDTANAFLRALGEASIKPH